MPARRDPERADVRALVARLAEDGVPARERARLIAQLGRALTGGARRAGARSTVSGRWLTDLVADAAEHVPVRDLLTLRTHHGGLSGDELAEALIRTASLGTAAVGAAGGALATAQAAAPPTLLAAPLQLTAETLAVVAVELKLVAELHVVYGRAPLGTRSQVATAYLTAWTTKRGIDITAGPPGLAGIVSSAARTRLRSRLLRRFGRNTSTLLPFLAGAAAGAELNRRETRSVGEALMADLRRR